MTPEHKLWAEVLKTFIEDASLSPARSKPAEFMLEVDSRWTKHICIMVGVNYERFRWHVLRTLYGGRCTNI